MVVVKYILHQQEGATPIPLSSFTFSSTTATTNLIVPPGQTCTTLKYESGNSVRIVVSSNRQTTNSNFTIPQSTYYHMSTGAQIQSTQFLDTDFNKVFVIDDDSGINDGYYDGGFTIWPASKIIFDFNLI